jgi:hypothetical protein
MTRELHGACIHLVCIYACQDDVIRSRASDIRQGPHLLCCDVASHKPPQCGVDPNICSEIISSTCRCTALADALRLQRADSRNMLSEMCFPASTETHTCTVECIERTHMIDQCCSWCMLATGHRFLCMQCQSPDRAVRCQTPMQPSWCRCVI